MKINSIQQSESISKYINNVSNSQARPSIASKISDTVELSEGAQKYSALMKAAREQADKIGSDEDTKVADIMERIKSNTYDVPSQQVAASIMNGPFVV